MHSPLFINPALILKAHKDKGIESIQRLEQLYGEQGDNQRKGLPMSIRFFFISRGQETCFILKNVFEKTLKAFTWIFLFEDHNFLISMQTSCRMKYGFYGNLKVSQEAHNIP